MIIFPKTVLRRIADSMGNIIIVNEDDIETGTGTKDRIHREGILHRAFSIFIFNSGGRIMLQRRAPAKYHSGGLWTNTCCGHPAPGADILSDARKRLAEEMGIDCVLREVFSFKYKIRFGTELFEHEWDHVFFGSFDNDPVINPEEADNWRWVSPGALLTEIDANPECFTYWFKAALPAVLERCT